MGRFADLFRWPAVPDAQQMQARPSARFEVEIPPEMKEFFTEGGSIAPRISRSLALQVPAVLRGRNLICSTIAALPLKVHGPDRREADGYLLGGNIDPDVPNTVTVAHTLEDLLFEEISWWRVTRFGWHGYPLEAEHLAVNRVHVATVAGGVQVYIDGMPVGDDQVIRFDSPNPGLLKAAARAIRTCLRLDETAGRYAEEPLPLGYFAEAEGADPADDDEIEAILTKWETARRTRAWGYLGGLEAKVLQFNAEQIQLADQRQHAVLEIARAMGIDPEDLGVSTTSRTYQNAEQRRLDLLDFTLSAYVKAFEQRLSMRDVLPRGYEAKVKFDGFLRSDALTRMKVYKLGREVGAHNDERIAALEDIPSAVPSSPATPTPVPIEEPRQRAEADVPANFDTDAETTVLFDTPDVVETFRVNSEKRTISGLIVPWGKVANNGQAKWRFEQGSLYWVDEGRTKLNLHHDHTQAVARAVRLQNTTAGLDASFQVARGAEGDRALSLAEDGVLDGFSVEIHFEDGDGWKPDPADKSVRLVQRAKLRGVALTAMPAFDDARVSAVAASLDQRKDNAMATETVTQDGQPAAEEFNLTEHLTKLTEATSESHKKLTEELGKSIGDSVSAGFKAALENLATPQADGPQAVRAARFQVTREEPVYAFAGIGHSLVRDAYYAQTQNDNDSKDRLRKYALQTEEMSKLAMAQISTQNFATVTTGTASAIIPPGYRPDLYVSELLRGRPLVNAASRGSIDNASPFTVPVFTSSTGATADHVEGTNPTDGSVSLTTKTVTPGGISGRLVLTREIVDSSNPAIDQIAMATMRESYARQTEAKMYTLYNGANGVGGTITGDNVPSGAQASTVVAAVSAAGGQALIKHLRERLAKYPFQRFAAPDVAVMGQNATTRLATAEGNDGRPLLPSVGAQNTAGVGNAARQAWFVDGISHVPAWAMTGTAAGDAQIIYINSADAWVWESPLLTFQYNEKSGPANIELAVFGYFGAHVLRPVGLSGVRITTT